MQELAAREALRRWARKVVDNLEGCVEVLFDCEVPVHQLMAREYELSRDYQVYVWCVGSGEEEHVVYVGIRMTGFNFSPRFANGHTAAMRLLDSKYDALPKHVYFARCPVVPMIETNRLTEKREFSV